MRPTLPLTLIVFLATATLAGCGGDGGPTPPPPDGNGNDSTVVLLSSANPADWSCGTACAGCEVQNDALVATDYTILDPSPPASCHNLRHGHDCVWTSAHRIDFRPYSSARLQFRLRVVSGSGIVNTVRIVVHSNVPGTGDLNVYSILQPGSDSTEDLSLANALQYAEATVEVTVRNPIYEPTPPCGVHSTVILLSDFKIVARRR